MGKYFEREYPPKTYRLDMSYPPDKHDINIGADAGNTCLPDNFASVQSAQCVYKCFMSDSDIRSIYESERILKEYGRFGIIPFYIDETFFISSSPYCDHNDIVIDDWAKKVWRDYRFKEPFSQHYSPESFKSKIWDGIPDNIQGKILFFKNFSEIAKIYPDQRIYCYFMFHYEQINH